MKDKEILEAKEILETRYKEELQREIINRFNMYCDNVNDCKDCEYSNGNTYQYDYQYICLAKFMLDYYNISRKFK